MEKVLLAIDGITPDQKVFQYAVELCKRIKADLNIFQIVNPANYKEYLKELRKSTKRAGKYMESTMAAVAFAEAGEHETALDIMAEASKNTKRLFPELEKTGVHYKYYIKSGDSDKEIIDYVDSHRNVVLAIYDASAFMGRLKNRKKRNIEPARIKEKLSIPLIVVNR